MLEIISRNLSEGGSTDVGVWTRSLHQVVCESVLASVSGLGNLMDELLLIWFHPNQASWRRWGLRQKF